MKKFFEYVKLTVLILGGIALITGTFWCQWAGYKERHPNGGCLGFITQPRGK